MPSVKQSEKSKNKTEIIAFSSGKGGTGKTLIATCLGYALTKIGLRVLMVDSDIATDGLSLYLLGPGGMDKVEEIPLDGTLIGILNQYQDQGSIQFNPWKINRSLQADHGVIYEAIISGRQLYGDRFESMNDDSTVRTDQESYRSVIQTIFDSLQRKAEFDYVIVDTRGGFSSQSTDVSALADSYIVVTEADVTSFYQNRNLVQYIDQAASEFGKKAVLRSIIVNKSTQFSSDAEDYDLNNLEASFRLQLEREFPIDYKSTHPLPLSIDALRVQKSHKIPLRHAPDSDFSYAFLSAFHDILSVVTQPWTQEQVDGWNYLVESVNLAIQKRNDDLQKAALEEQAQNQELEKLRKENSEYANRISSLEREIGEIDERYKRELERSDVLAAKMESRHESPPASSKLKAAEKPRMNWIFGVIGLVVIGVIGSLVIFGSSLFPGFSTQQTPTHTVTAPSPTDGILLPTETISNPPELTPTAEMTSTLVISETPTSTPIPCPTSQFDPGKVIFPSGANFVDDITIPDGFMVSPNQQFTKTWLIQNIGYYSWNSTYSIVFYAGDPMGAKTVLPFPDQEVLPGGCVEISIDMTAPGTPQEYTGYWLLLEDNRITRFGLINLARTKNDLPLSVIIVVSSP